MPPFQTRVAEFIAAHELNNDVNTRLLDLVSEVGEASKEILKATAYGTRAFESNDAWRAELGDIFFALACLANASHVNLEDALRAALEKYAARLREHQTVGSGI